MRARRRWTCVDTIGRSPPYLGVRPYFRVGAILTGSSTVVSSFPQSSAISATTTRGTSRTTSGWDATLRSAAHLPAPGSGPTSRSALFQRARAPLPLPFYGALLTQQQHEAYSIRRTTSGWDAATLTDPVAAFEARRRRQLGEAFYQPCSSGSEPTRYTFVI